MRSATSFIFLCAALLPYANLQLFAQDDASDCEAREEECGPSFAFPLPHRFSIDPEIYHLQRNREGGTKQDGWMYGVRANYDYIKRYCIYWGIDGLWAKGKLDGRNGAGDKLKSTFTDSHIEGRLGYTFQAKWCCQPAFTPFVGYGYFRDTNKFQEPSPLLVKFITTYRYVSYGFVSSISPVDDLNVGFNFKGWSMIHPRTKVEDDFDEDDASMLMGERFNYRIELPILYRYCACNEHLEIGLTPFYEFRHYGRRENFPFDYADTKFRLWGFTLQLTYRL